MNSDALLGTLSTAAAGRAKAAGLHGGPVEIGSCTEQRPAGRCSEGKPGVKFDPATPLIETGPSLTRCTAAQTARSVSKSFREARQGAACCGICENAD